MLELTHLKNRLIANKFDEFEQLLLNQIKEKIERSDSPFSKVMLMALENCVADIKVKNFDSAIREIQLILNFPVVKNEDALWDEEHFYQIELPSYIEKVNNTHRIKQLIKELAEI